MRNNIAPALRSSCKASNPVGVVPLLGGPGENPTTNFFCPFISSTLSELTVTTEWVWAAADQNVIQVRARSSQNLKRWETKIVNVSFIGALKFAPPSKPLRTGEGQTRLSGQNYF